MSSHFLVVQFSMIKCSQAVSFSIILHHFSKVKSFFSFFSIFLVSHLNFHFLHIILNRKRDKIITEQTEMSPQGFVAAGSINIDFTKTGDLILCLRAK